MPGSDEEAEESEFAFRHSERTFFLTSLEDDVKRSEAFLAPAPDDDFARRTFVRTVIAEIEGLSASAIHWARYYSDESSVFKSQYSEAERTVLHGKTAQINEKGEACLVSDRYPPTKSNIRFALSLVGRGAANLPKIDYGEGGWQALTRALGIRDRLMHPKKADDLIVDEELDQVRRGRTWLVATYESLEGALQKERSAELSRWFRERKRALDRDEPSST